MPAYAETGGILAGSARWLGLSSSYDSCSHQYYAVGRATPAAASFSGSERLTDWHCLLCGVDVANAF